VSLRIARLLLALVLAIVASGAPSVVRAAFDEECCEQGCDDPDEGTPCSPDCSGPCANAAHPLVPMPARSLAREAAARSSARMDTVVPVLPLVVTGVFHPPRS
jgi:hypothetical protein